MTDHRLRDDLATFAERAVRLDGAAVVRLRERAGGGVMAYVATGFDVLASRVNSAAPMVSSIDPFRSAPWYSTSPEWMLGA